MLAQEAGASNPAARLAIRSRSRRQFLTGSHPNVCIAGCVVCVASVEAEAKAIMSEEM
jgi:hypothetical protein